jgi:glutamate-5-semialdehyde dehydrogenase
MTALDMASLGKRARAASKQIALATTDEKNRVIHAIADALEQCTDVILAANAKDLEIARSQGKSETLIRDRFDLSSRMKGMIAEVRNVASLPDPVGKVIEERALPNGLNVKRQHTPLGVIGVIYEARPNVTVDCATLALKSGNASVLRGGSEVFNSNIAMVSLIRDTIAAQHIPAIPPDVVQFIESTDRAYIEQMLKLYDDIDMIIPRGGASLHKFCKENSLIPVITGGLGVVHTYVDDTADLAAALPVIWNEKMQRPSVCNALDTLLVHEAVAAAFLPRVVDLLRPANVEIRAEPKAHALIGHMDGVIAAGDGDFDTEWMALILGVKVVSGIDDALAHIHAHSTLHSEAILSSTPAHIERFINEVDAAGVFVNASTRFNDGGALGLGAEIAVSTQKIHARGPMALAELTSYKWVVSGDYTVRG